MWHAATVTIRIVGPIDADLAKWNDRMYELHPTPYGRGLAGLIEDARVRTVLALASIGPGDAVIEIGCESGRLLARVPAVRRLVGVDISRRALEDAGARLAGRTIELAQLDAQRGLPFDPGEFDVILCSEMLEHVAQPEEVLGRIAAMSTAATRIVVSVPLEAPKLRVKEALRRIRLLERLFPGIEPGQSEWHVHAFSSAMLRALTSRRFDTVRARRVWLAHEVALLRLRTPVT